MIRFLITVFFVTIFHLQAYALELLMVNNKHCIYCNKFLKEVASTYKIQSLPLRIISDHDQPEWFKTAYKTNKIKPIRGTPTFILWDETENYEVDRIVGYRNKDQFYKQLKDAFVNFLNQNDLNS
tara:strand:+ start:109 stop:483 length:375 start_codon:yes stop_codon:yes gene_type:complete